MKSQEDMKTKTTDRFTSIHLSHPNESHEISQAIVTDMWEDMAQIRSHWRFACEIVFYTVLQLFSMQTFLKGLIGQLPVNGTLLGCS